MASINAETIPIAGGNADREPDPLSPDMLAKFGGGLAGKILRDVQQVDKQLQMDFPSISPSVAPDENTVEEKILVMPDGRRVFWVRRGSTSSQEALDFPNYKNFNNNPNQGLNPTDYRGFNDNIGPLFQYWKSPAYRSACCR